MTPFPGESLRIFDAHDGAGYSLGPDIRYRARSRTITAGDVWRAWVAPGEVAYLEDPAGVVVSWVVEVTSGTVTLTVGEALDPDFGDSGLAPSPLGTFTVTGPATLVVPSTITAAQVLDGSGDSFMLHLAATSGSAVVQQAKLRVWPAVGAAGGWSDVLPGFSTGPATPTLYWHHFRYSGEVTDADFYAAWDAARAAQVLTEDHDPADYLLAPEFGAAAGAGGTISRPSGGDVIWTAQAGVSAYRVVLVGPDWSTAYPVSGDLVEGVDYVTPPAEVPGDPDGLVQRVGAGSVTWSGDITGQVGGPAQEFGQPAIGATTTDALTVAAVTGGATIAGVPTPAATPLTVTRPPVGDTAPYSLAPLAGTGGRYGVLVLDHTFHDTHGSPWTASPPPTGINIQVSESDTYSVNLDAIRAAPNLPPYRVWLPIAVTLEPLRIFQRGDALGAGSGRILGAGTRQSSSKVFGAL